MFYYWFLWQEEIHGAIDNNIDHETTNEEMYHISYIAYHQVYGSIDYDNLPY